MKSSTCYFQMKTKILADFQICISVPLTAFDFKKVKGALLGLRQFLATESSLKMMKDAFYFTSKALFVLKIFKFLSGLFGHV